MTNTNNHHRRPIRIPEYDYTQPGAYFVTICTWQRECIFGEVVDEKMRLNGYGEIVETCWNELKGHYENIEMDEMIVMPNHIHGIINIVGATLAVAQKERPAKLGHVVGGFKSLSVKCCLEHIKRKKPGMILGKLWQRNYYEHVIRDDVELAKTREYIVNNPMKWELDENYPDVVRKMTL